MTPLEDPTPSWPPVDGLQFVHSEEFAQIIERIALELQEKYANLDLIAAVGLVWDWFDRTTKRDSSFFERRRFPTLNAVRAYVRQALWRAALNENRKEARRARHLHPLPMEWDPVDPRTAPSEGLEMLDELQLLPPKIGAVVEAIAVNGQSIEQVARSLGLSPQEVQRLYERGLDLLADRLRP